MITSNSVRKMVLILCLSIGYFLLSSHVYADDYTETFNGSLNSLFWETSRGHLAYQTDSDKQFALMQVPNNVNPFYYFKSREFTEIKPDYSSISIGLRFSHSPVVQGAGYILSDNVPSQGSPLLFNTYMFYIWPKPNGTFHLFTPLCSASNPNCDTDYQLYAGVYPMPTDNNWHTIILRRVGSHYEFVLDDLVIFTTIDTQRVVSRLGIGDPENTLGSQTWPVLYLDYIGLDYHPLARFPYLSQLDLTWSQDEYDSASSWAPVGKTGIDRWGCALTSAAMILQNYGVKTIEDATPKDVTPDYLNNWLKSQPDGYVGSGYLNWLAITRFARESYDVGHSKKKLEFSRSYDATSATKPSIIGLPGHFVVAYDINNNNEWIINDPASESNKLLSKNSAITSINTFIPSETDLSYMLFVKPRTLNASLLLPTGSISELKWDDEYITDDVEKVLFTPYTQLAMLQKPSDGLYKLYITNREGSSRSFETYLYDRSGYVTKDILIIPPKTEATFVIDYSSTSENKNTISIDYTSIFDYLKSLRKPKTQANGIFQALYSKFAELLTDMSGINDLGNFINKQSPRVITPDVKGKLQNYIMLIEQN